MCPPGRPGPPGGVQAGEGPAAAEAFGPFVLVVREHEIVAAAVDVEAVAEQVE